MFIFTVHLFRRFIDESAELVIHSWELTVEHQIVVFV